MVRIGALVTITELLESALVRERLNLLWQACDHFASDQIRNAATVPATARNAKEATEFVGFLLSPEAQSILKDTGQPPVVPAIRKGAVPAALN